MSIAPIDKLEEDVLRAAKSIHWVQKTLRKVANHRLMRTEEQVFNRSTLLSLANSLDPDCNPVMAPLHITDAEKKKKL